MTCVCRSFNLFRGMGTKHTRKFNCCQLYSTLIEPQRDQTVAKHCSLVHFQNEKQIERGIRGLLGPTPQLLAQIKEKCRHFQVHEIDPDGNRVQLTDLTPLPSETAEMGKGNRFIHFTVYKERYETSEAAWIINKKIKNTLRRGPHVRYAGRKDKKAQTSQRMSVLNFPGVAELLPKLGTPNLRLGNFSYAPSTMFLGQLRGNHFHIFLDDLEFDQSMDTEFNLDNCKSTLDESVRNLRDKGFINYYGLQRFGFNALNIGAAVVASDWEKAFDLILTPFNIEKDFVDKVKYLWQTTRDPREMLKAIPPEFRRSNIVEVKLTMGLLEHYMGGQGSLARAYEQIPEEVCEIHASAFNSYIWNEVASYRIQKFGDKVLPGDAVIVGNKNEIKLLTQEDVQSDKYSIYDVLQPFLGGQINHYENPRLQEFCTHLLSQFGVTPSSLKKYNLFRMSREQKGGYRTLLVKPSNVSYRMISSDEYKNLETFMPSDLDLLEVNEVNEGQQGSISFIEDVENGEEEESKIGAILEFSLPPSSYATMALREIIQ